MPKLVPCPTCNQTHKQPDGRPCQNCGGQSPLGFTSGLTYEREDGTACVHETVGTPTFFPSVTEHRCKHCPFYFQVDLGDVEK